MNQRKQGDEIGTATPEALAQAPSAGGVCGSLDAQGIFVFPHSLPEDARLSSTATPYTQVSPLRSVAAISLSSHAKRFTHAPAPSRSTLPPRSTLSPPWRKLPPTPSNLRHQYQRCRSLKASTRLSAGPSLSGSQRRKRQPDPLLTSGIRLRCLPSLFAARRAPRTSATTSLRSRNNLRPPSLPSSFFPPARLPPTRRRLRGQFLIAR